MTGDRQTQAQSNFYNTFTYQGRITSDFGPGSDDSPHTWEFLFKAVIPPYPCADIIDCPWRTNCPNCATFVLGTNSVIVNQGLFMTPIAIPTALLDSSNGVFLEISVRSNSNVPFTTLSPLQPLTATPFATMAQSVVGPVPASSLTGALPSGLLTGTYSSPLGLSNPGNVFAGDGSQLTHVNATTIAGGEPLRLDQLLLDAQRQRGHRYKREFPWDDRQQGNDDPGKQFASLENSAHRYWTEHCGWASEQYNHRGQFRHRWRRNSSARS